MMTRHSAEPPGNMLSGETRELLRSTISRLVDDDSGTDDEPGASAELHAALQRAADEARAQQMHAEELVIAFKELLYSLPNGSTPQERLRRARLRERLVSLCIRAYYGAE